MPQTKTFCPLIVNVRRHSLEDGPGIRSVVFFKGCPLRCVFCHNGEAQDPDVEIGYFDGQCVHCGACADACPRSAIDLTRPGRIDRARCNRCGTCADVCPGGGLRRIGRAYPVESLVDLLLRDVPFYRHSGGGVTLSGGEPTLYPEYLNRLLTRMKSGGIHTALQTSGHFDYETFAEKVLPHLDLIYFDVKFSDPDVHRRYTGQTNDRILDNLRRLVRQNAAKVHPRIPLVPGITASAENLHGIISFLRDIGARDVSLLPYNPMGIDMAASLGKEQLGMRRGFMTPDEERNVSSTVQALTSIAPRFTAAGGVSSLEKEQLMAEAPKILQSS